VHEVGVRVFLQDLVDPLRRLVHVLVVVVVKRGGLIGGARVERRRCPNDYIELRCADLRGKILRTDGKTGETRLPEAAAPALALIKTAQGIEPAVQSFELVSGHPRDAGGESEDLVR
jgi:hypothetical protein